MINKKMFVIVGLIFMLGAGQAMAQESFAGKWWRMPDVAAQMKLTKQEQEKLDELYRANRRNLIDQRARMEKHQLALEESMEAEPLNEPDVFKKFNKVEKVRASLAEERFRYYLGVRKILGAERFEQLQQARKNFWHARRSGMGSDEGIESRRR